jgi:acid phosphatase type 7
VLRRRSLPALDPTAIARATLLALLLLAAVPAAAQARAVKVDGRVTGAPTVRGGAVTVPLQLTKRAGRALKLGTRSVGVRIRRRARLPLPRRGASGASVLAPRALRTGDRLKGVTSRSGKAHSALSHRYPLTLKLASARVVARAPHWQPRDVDPVVAAAGDIACDPLSPYFGGGLGQGIFCRQRRTSELLLRMDLAAVLMPGDLQYEDGKLWKFEQSFDPSWGRLRHLLRPAPGNHEYRDPDATGYFDYFNGPGRRHGRAGERGAGYYSFDVGDWHLVALNSECHSVGGCQAGSPQERWLRADLASHPVACTLAFWHHPQFTSGRHSAEGTMRAVWDALYEANVDLVINGHEHFYERFAPQTPDGVPDPARGIRQITVGTGGKNRFGYVGVAPNSELRENRYHGVLTLGLHPAGYDWKFVTTPRGRVADRGAAGCH